MARSATRSGTGAREACGRASWRGARRGLLALPKGREHRDAIRKDCGESALQGHNNQPKPEHPQKAADGLILLVVGPFLTT